MRRLRCSRTGATATLGEASANSRTKAGLPNRMWGGYIRPAFVASVPPFVVSLRSGLMAPRAYWKGYLKLSLVSCPIALSPATSSSDDEIEALQVESKHTIEIDSFVPAAQIDK